MDRKIWLLVVALAIFLNPATTFAATLISLPSDASEGDVYSHNTGDIGKQNLGTGLEGIVTAVGLQGWSGGSTVDIQAVIQCFTDSAYALPCTTPTSTPTTIDNSGVAANGSGGTGGGWTRTYQTAYQLLPQNYYRIYATASSGLFKWGKRLSSTGVPADWVDNFSCTGCTNSGSTAHGLSFRLETLDDGQITPSQPESGEAFASLSDAVFEGFYNRTCTASEYTHAHFRISFSTGTTTNAYIPLSSCSLTLYQYQLGATYLPYIGTYTYQVRLTKNAPPLSYNPVGTTFSASTTFSVLSLNNDADFDWDDSAIIGDSLLNGSILDGGVLGDDNVSTTTLYNQTRTGFAIVDAIQTKFPFNWIVGFGQTVTELQTLTSTTSLPEMEVDFGYLHSLQSIPTSTPMNWTVTFLSTQTFYDVAQMSSIQLARSMAVYILWIVLLLFVVKEAYGIFGRGRSWESEGSSEVGGRVTSSWRSAGRSM